MNLNSPPSHFPMHQISHENDHEQPFLPNQSSSMSCHFFFDPGHDHTGFYDHHHLYRPSHRPTGDHRSYGGSSLYETDGGAGDGLELTLWKKESDEVEIRDNNSSINNPMRWMSSKMRVMQKMKKTDHDGAAKRGEAVSSSSTELSSNSSSYNNSSPIRVCSDCNTTKTPLWRSGPKGPKSLCNACGIRQRKARRAMAAAAANGGAQPPATKIKLQTKGKSGHASPQLKKRCKTAAATAASAGNGQKRINFEDFLINLSKNLAFHRVFPDDEKDAAILLMALSSGLVNG